MSPTDLPRSPKTDSPSLGSSTDLTDWLHLSPYQYLPSSSTTSRTLGQPTRLDSSSLRFETSNGAQEDTTGLPKLLGSFPRTNAPHISTSPRDIKKILTDPDAARLALCNYTPSPTQPSNIAPDISDVCSQSPPSLHLLSPMRRASSLNSSQESYDLNAASPFDALFYFRDNVGSFQSDASPVIRNSQDQDSEDGYENRENRRINLKAGTKKKARGPMFVDQLKTVSDENTSGLQTPKKSSSGHNLLSPCKISTSSRHTLTIPKDSRADTGLRSRRTKHAVQTKGLSDQNEQLNALAYVAMMASPLGISNGLPSRVPKRAREDDTAPDGPEKKARIEASAPRETQSLYSSSNLNRTDTAAFPFSTRIFPSSVEISPLFGLFYRRSPASSYFQPAGLSSPCSLFKVTHPGGVYNPPRSAFDLYTPRFVKGKGADKVGLCPICIEPEERGGEGKKLWLAMKFSAFKCYHMQYYHGISATSGKPFSPPLSFRVVPRKNPLKGERKEMREGKCHKCSKWIAVEGVKDVDNKVKELYWWKHAAACHKHSTIPGETGIWEEDTVYARLLELETPAADSD